MKRPRRLSIILIAAIGFVLAAWQTIRWAYPPFAPPVLPVPNGYDQLLEAAKQLAPRTDFYQEMETGELTAIVEQNKPVLAMVTQALQKDCGVPVDWSSDPSTGKTQDLDLVSSIRNLVRALSADVRKKMLDGNGSEAVAPGIATFQLGQECYRGGLMVNLLIGVAIQAHAIDELRQIAIQYPATRTKILAGIQPLLTSGESAEAVIERETDYIHSATRGVMGIVVRMNSKQMLQPAVDAARQSALRLVAKQRLFLLHLGVNAYHDQHGTWPVQLADLAPDILPAIYLDPYNNAGFVYRIENEQYRLYSKGRDGRDDGGAGDDSGLAEDFVDDFVAEQP